MAYSKERAASISKSDIKYIPAGINENVVLKSVKAEVSPNGNPFLEITFEKDGAILTHTEWEPTKGNFVTTDEALQDKFDKQYSRMLQILGCYYDDTLLNFNGETFKEFSNWVAAMLGAADKNKKLRVKVVYNNKGYTTLPSYARYTFIEPMQLPKDETTAIAALNIDQFQKPVVADTEVANNNPLSTPQQGMTAFASPADELPF